MASKKKSSAALRKEQIKTRSAAARGVPLAMPRESRAVPVANAEVVAPTPVPDGSTLGDLRRVHRQVATAEKRLDDLRALRKSILLDLVDEGTSWTELGGVVGLSRQAVRKWA